MRTHIQVRHGTDSYMRFRKFKENCRMWRKMFTATASTYQVTEHSAGSRTVIRIPMSVYVHCMSVVGVYGGRSTHLSATCDSLLQTLVVMFTR